MTPAARLSAAAEVLDLWLDGAPVEKVLTNWARRSRFAGSKDRAAVRDIVFDCLRNRARHAQLPDTARGLIIGHACRAGVDLDAVFDGVRHAPAPLSAQERELVSSIDLDAPGSVTEYPAWLKDCLETSLGGDLQAIAEKMRARAPVFLRVNAQKSTTEDVIALLTEDQIETRPHPLAATVLEVLTNQRRVTSSRAWSRGLVELQDAASQAVCAEVPMPAAGRVLDYCAGGGGKALALAARSNAEIYAYDVASSRMKDIADRAARAGVQIATLSDPAERGPYDVVLCDVPCSGSGAWRRSPEGKWRLTEGGLNTLLETQAQILRNAAQLVAPGGYVVYATCSLLRCENTEQIARFMSQNSGWEHCFQRVLSPLEGGDGFFCAGLKKESCDGPVKT